MRIIIVLITAVVSQARFQREARDMAQRVQLYLAQQAQVLGSENK